MLQKALSEIELRLRLKNDNTSFTNSYRFNKKLEIGTYQLIISDIGFMYFKNELEKKMKKAIKLLEKHHAMYYFFTIYENEEGEIMLLM